MNALETKLLPIARKWAGNIPIWEARRANIDTSSIRHWAQNNPNVTRTGHGIYTWFYDDPFIDWSNSEIARHVAEAGPDAYLWGLSVLELMDIGDVMEPFVYVAVPKRRRPKEGVRWIVGDSSPKTRLKGIPAQNLSTALEVSMPRLDPPKQDSVIRDLQNGYSELEEVTMKLCDQYGIQ